jgi:PD-(D/E)XK nuclease superfamily
MVKMSQPAPLLLSRSELDCWARCPRKWLVTYYWGYQPADPVPYGSRESGTRIHTALEGYYGYQLDPLATIALLYKLAIEEHPGHEKELRAEHELARVMIEGYLEWAAAESIDADYRTVYTESDVQAPLPGLPGVILRARLDQVMEQISTGFLLFHDFKTADNFSRHELIRMDTQMKFYALVSHLSAGAPLDGAYSASFAPVVGGGVVTTLRRVKRTAKAKPPFYERTAPFRYSPGELISTLCRAQALAGEIIRARWIMDEACRGTPEQIQAAQRSICRPVPDLHTCTWQCPLAAGVCGAMDDSTGWMQMLESSGRFVRADPYAHYQTGGIAGIREHLPQLAGIVGLDAGEGEG